jgi:uncharacterized protein YfaT (DUF1175 family)
MKSSLAWTLAGAAGIALAAAALVPIRHQAWQEVAAGNPVQRVVMESRSLLGFKRAAWGASARSKGPVEIWGNARDGFFLAPREGVQVEVDAWPGFRQSMSLSPIAGDGAASLLGEGDREAFRAWFVAILEQQLEGLSPVWDEAQRDCAGLLRFAFREAWGPHTEAWRDRIGFAPSPVAGDPNPALAGPWRSAFPTPEGWKPFARGAFLRTQSCVFMGKELGEARPGDLIFFARGGANPQPDHAMAFVRSDLDGQPMLLYHTGPESARPVVVSGAVSGALSSARPAPGEVRRVRLDELMHHPDAAFRPTPENPAFLGLYRWKVLCSASLLRDLSLQASR